MGGVGGCAVEIGPGIMISAHVDAGSGAPVHVVHERGGGEAAAFGGLGPSKILAIIVDLCPFSGGDITLIIRDVDPGAPSAQSNSRVSDQDDREVNNETK